MFALLLTGCASQGPLRPPSLHLPAVVSGLAAERIGGVVVVRWTNPTRTSDGVMLAGKHDTVPLVAAVCRQAVTAEPCVPIASVPVISGQPGMFRDVLPAELASGAPRQMLYRVRVLNAKGRGAGDASIPALAGAAPHMLVQLRAQLTPGGAELQWQPDPEAGNDQIVLRVQQGGNSPASGQPASQDVRTRQTLLSVSVNGVDPGGARDPAARPGMSEQYTVTRVRTMRVDNRELTMSSALVTVTLQAGSVSVPLPPPPGLEALVNTVGAAPEIDLVWEPVTDAAGYQVYRSTGTGDRILLTKELQSGITYTDRGIEPGQTYRYSVTSVDSNGKAGPHSKGVVVTMTSQQ